ncbi:unnamed protein product [Tilletia controversa]|nr:unnamed protein product [Tilletia controversa]CAD6961162.1 unnamed protein product [Tilletia controversa]CAD6963552.1 unnamed protein product [Tilletia controversa]CAD6966696.1 unnamed protein product [Tilletia controversa]
MHPRSPYAKAPPDFASLARDHPNFGQHVKVGEDGISFIDFKDADAVRALTEVLLLADFKIVAEQAPDRLCPMVPNRLNYVLWLQDVVAETRRILALAHRIPSSSHSTLLFNGGDSSERPAKRARREYENIQPRRPSLRGLDIGTGASTIYPLLMCATDPCADMVGTDIDETSLAHANDILAHPFNAHLHPRTRIRTVLKRPDDPFFSIPSAVDHAEAKEPRFHITMCNPPFYASKEEMSESSRGKARKPPAVCTGTEREMVFEPEKGGGGEGEGGEVGFVRRMIEESFSMEKWDLVWWFTSMLGRLGSVDTLLHDLQKKGKAGMEGEGTARHLTWVVHELVQGNTKRWVLAWSFMGVHIADTGPEFGGTTVTTLARHRPPGILKTDWLIHAGDVGSARAVLGRVMEGIAGVEVVDAGLVVMEKEDKVIRLEIVVWMQSWTRAARRARERGEDAAPDDEEKKEAVLCVEATVRALSESGAEENAEGEGTTVSAEVTAKESARRGSVVDFRRTFGHSRAVFDSFSQHVKSRWTALSQSAS